MNDLFDVNRYRDLIEQEIDTFTTVLEYADLSPRPHLSRLDDPHRQDIPVD